MHLGNELIKQVVDQLRRDEDDPQDLRDAVAAARVPRVAPRAGRRRRPHRPPSVEAFAGDAHAIVALDDRRWLDDRVGRGPRQPAVLSAAARYLQSTRDGRARDPVANFHLSNGASLERLNWLANPASYGIEESLG